MNDSITIVYYSFSSVDILTLIICPLPYDVRFDSSYCKIDKEKQDYQNGTFLHQQDQVQVVIPYHQIQMVY